MRNIYLLLIGFSVSLLWSQQRYQILDLELKSPVEGAEVLSSEKELLTYSDEEGWFSVEENVKFVIIQAERYEEKYVQLNPKTPLLFLTFQEKLTEVVVKARDDLARKLIREVIQKRRQNHPDNLESYGFKVYNRYLMDAERDSIIPRIEENEDGEIDSIGFEAKAFFDKSAMFLWEKVEQMKHSKQYGNKIDILAQRMSGLKQPIYEMLAIRPNSWYLEDSEFNFFLTSYPNPISKLGLQEFKYSIVDTTEIQGKPAISVSFSPKIFDKAIKPFMGYVRIDVESKSIVELYGERTESPYAYIHMKWKERAGYFFPENQYFYLDLSDAGMVQMNTGGTNVPILLDYRTNFKDFEIPKTFEKKEFKGYEYEVAPELVKESDEILRNTRDSLTRREEGTYVAMDSIFEAENVNRYIKYHHILTRGTFPIGKKLELDYMRLFQINDYEGFRPEINLSTNENFHLKWRIKGYGAYGFKDKEFKFGSTLSYLVNPGNSGNIYASYSQDVHRFGRFVPKMFYDRTLVSEVVNSYYYRNYYKSQNAQLGYEQDFFQNVTTRFYGEWAENQSGVPYSYNFESVDSKYRFINGHLVVVWRPFHKYFKTPYGKVTLEKKPTYIGLHFMKSFGDLGSDFDFESLELMLGHQWEYFLGKLGIFGRAGKLWGYAPLYYHFEGGGNAPNKNHRFFEDLSISGYHLMETLMPSRFNMDRYVNFQLSQTLPRISIGKGKITPVLFYKGLWGDLEHTNHALIPLEAPTEFYQEMGAELNNVFKFIGVGGYYRLGNYQVGEFKDDFYFKLNFEFPFGN